MDIQNIIQRLKKNGHSVLTVRDEDGKISGIVDGEEKTFDEIKTLMSPETIFNGVSVQSKNKVDEITIERILNIVREDGDQWLKINAMLRELMLALAAVIVIVKVLASSLTPEQKAPHKKYFDQLDASLELASRIAQLRDEGIAFKADPNNKL